MVLEEERNRIEGKRMGFEHLIVGQLLDFQRDQIGSKTKFTIKQTIRLIN